MNHELNTVNELNSKTSSLTNEQRIQSDENQLLQSITALKEAQPMKQSKRVFGMDSPMQKELMSKKLAAINQNVTLVNDYLHSERVPIDEDGNKLINYSVERGWFFDNVSFIFSTGVIFDEEDTSKLDSVLRCFQNQPNRGYIKNRYFVLNYENALVQKIESMFRIENGNYRILCAVVVSATDEQLKNAPEYQFSQKGVNHVYTEWSDIDSLFANYLSCYGFIAEYFDKQDITFKNSQRMDRKNMYNAQMSVSPVDLLQTPIEKFESGGKKNEYDEREFRQFRTSKAFAEDQRGKQLEHRGDYRRKQGASLYDRMNDEPLQTVPSKFVGATYRMDDAYLSNDETPAEFIIYNNLDTYDKSIGKNIFMNQNPTDKQLMPNFSANPAGIDRIMNGSKPGKVGRLNGSPLIFPK